MFRKILIVLGVVIVAAAGAYFVFGNSATSAQDGKTAEQVPASQGVSIAGGAAEGGEFWTKRCNEDGDKYCEIFQRLTITENNQRLIEFAVGYPKEMNGAPQAAIVLPLGVVVTDGITLQVDDGAPAKAAYRLCTGDGCFVVMNLPDTFLTSMKKGEKIVVSFLDSSSQKVNIEMSLQGFGKKVDEVKG